MAQLLLGPCAGRRYLENQVPLHSQPEPGFCAVHAEAVQYGSRCVSRHSPMPTTNLNAPQTGRTSARPESANLSRTSRPSFPTLTLPHWKKRVRSIGRFAVLPLIAQTARLEGEPAEVYQDVLYREHQSQVRTPVMLYVGATHMRITFVSTIERLLNVK